jgi:hypothetical protein
VLEGWRGVGRIVAGMARQEYDLQLTRHGQEGWRATFYPAGLGHSLTPMVGSNWEDLCGLVGPPRRSSSDAGGVSFILVIRAGLPCWTNSDTGRIDRTGPTILDA